MKLLILEDEPLAIKGLEDMIRKHYKHVLIHRAQSVKDGKILLESTDDYTLIISDIRLTDGLSFDLFNQTDLDIPVIFSTAYDEYALKAFDYNGIAYVLKPVNEEKLISAMQKAMQRYRSYQRNQLVAISEASKSFRAGNAYKKRFLSKAGNRMIIKSIEEISMFYVDNKVVFMKEKGANKKYVINHSLDELETELLDPDQFYRINRSVIINLDSLLEMNQYANGRLKLRLNTDYHQDLIVSRERVPHFKSWINR